MAKLFIKFQGTRALVIGLGIVAALLSAKGHTVVHHRYGFFDGPG